MKIVKQAVILGLIGMTALASSVSADRATLSDNDWNGMTRVEHYAGSALYADDFDNASILRHPSGVLPLDDGSILIADTVNQVIKRAVDGEVVTFGGLNLLRDERGMPIGAHVDGVLDASVFHHPTGMDIDAEGNIYIADAGNHAIRIIAPDGTVTTAAGNGVLGHADGYGEDAMFYHPSDVAVAADGTIYVADTLNHAIRRIEPGGEVTTLNALSTRVIEIHPGVVEESGDYKDGPLSEALFNEPSGLALDGAGNLYVSDTGNHRIRYIDLTNGTVTTVAGASYANKATGRIYADTALYAEGFYKDGPASEALFYSPRGIALTEEGGLLIADSENHAIRYLKDGQVTTVVGMPEQYGYVNGIEQNNRLYRPTDVAVADDGTMLIADTYNNVIRQLRLYETPPELAPSPHIQVVYNDRLIAFDVPPEVDNGRTMIPVRFVAEALGYDVAFDEHTQEIILTDDQMAIAFKLGELELTVRNGDEQLTRQIDAAPYAKHNRTYVPVRFFAEVTGMDVAWIQDVRTVIIRDKVFE